MPNQREKLLKKSNNNKVFVGDAKKILLWGQNSNEKGG